MVPARAGELTEKRPAPLSTRLFPKFSVSRSILHKEFFYKMFYQTLKKNQFRKILIRLLTSTPDQGHRDMGAAPPPPTPPKVLHC